MPTQCIHKERQVHAYGHTNGFTLQICSAIVGYGSNKKHSIMCLVVTGKHQHPTNLKYSDNPLSVKPNPKY